MREFDFDVSAIAMQGVLTVAVRVPKYAANRDIELYLYRIVRAFACVEGIDESRIEGLRWDKKSDSEQADYFVLRREFSDPDYPRRFEKALDMTSGVGGDRARRKPRRGIAALFQRCH